MVSASTLNRIGPNCQSIIYMKNKSHSLLFGYLSWLLGFMGCHRFYYGKPKTATLYFFTLGLLGIGWLVDLFLIPSMNRAADRRYIEGPYDYDLYWLLLIFLGVFGVHRLLLGKIFSGILFLLTGGLFGLGWLYDLWTLNDQIDEANKRELSNADR
jgi:TM2 domain-containing membrane protein YozV